MARALNKVMLIGNLATDPELKYTPNGSMVCTFVIATNRRYTKSDGTMAEEAEFTPIASWGKLAEVCQKILAKGMLAFVEGRLKTRQWEGQDGTRRYKTEIRALDVILLDSKDRTPQGMPAAPDAPVEPKSEEAPAKEERSSSATEISDDELEAILDETDSPEDSKESKEDKKEE